MKSFCMADYKKGLNRGVFFCNLAAREFRISLAEPAALSKIGVAGGGYFGMGVPQQGN